MGVITIADISVKPGQSQSIDLPLPTLYSHTPVSMPVHVINGRREGPVLFISAAIHGDEINGVEIIRRLMKRKDLRKIKGALILVPVVNVYGFVNQSRYLPDRRDLNRSFPGTETGSMASRLAYIFMKEIVSHCTHGIDLHTGAIGRENLPQIRACVLKSAETKAMAHAFGTPVIINAELRDGSLREAVSVSQIPVLLYEAGEALRFDEASIRAGLKGIVNVIRHLGMLPQRKSRKIMPEQLVAKSSRWVRAPQSGILRSITPMGEKVKKGDIIGWVSDPFGDKEQPVLASISGIVIGKINLPLIHEGEALFHIARYLDSDSIVDLVENFQDEHDPLMDQGSGKEPVLY